MNHLDLLSKLGFLAQRPPVFEDVIQLFLTSFQNWASWSSDHMSLKMSYSF
ncbi:hypothetical protein DPMN_126237 [Dreissena polymorpha]|uniref:Uncharacterized protein n=1 Tax=Dreissena polymorpha TaxID=45954 RepID=A0A9D4GVC1_DREPO|nr:hypothetical protein DPMN_126237 [Dreissena polymorpha]